MHNKRTNDNNEDNSLPLRRPSVELDARRCGPGYCESANSLIGLDKNAGRFSMLAARGGGGAGRMNALLEMVVRRRETSGYLNVQLQSREIVSTMGTRTRFPRTWYALGSLLGSGSSRRNGAFLLLDLKLQIAD
jgi:hypothetical protein